MYIRTKILSREGGYGISTYRIFNNRTEIIIFNIGQYQEQRMARNKRCFLICILKRLEDTY